MHENEVTQGLVEEDQETHALGNKKEITNCGLGYGTNMKGNFFEKHFFINAAVAKEFQKYLIWDSVSVAEIHVVPSSEGGMPSITFKSGDVFNKTRLRVSGG